MDFKTLLNRITKICTFGLCSGCCQPKGRAAPTGEDMEEVTTGTGLKYVDLAPGSGQAAAPGNQVSVLYTGTLTDGKVFDTTKKRGDTPFEFKLGGGQVIAGWDEGVQGMKIGGKRKLTIPPELGYGAAGAGGVIPPNATLIFEIELLKLK